MSRLIVHIPPCCYENANESFSGFMSTQRQANVHTYTHRFGRNTIQIEKTCVLIPFHHCDLTRIRRIKRAAELPPQCPWAASTRVSSQRGKINSI